MYRFFVDTSLSAAACGTGRVGAGIKENCKLSTNGIIICCFSRACGGGDGLGNPELISKVTGETHICDREQRSSCNKERIRLEHNAVCEHNPAT